jgi:hypothetical protein
MYLTPYLGSTIYVHNTFYGKLSKITTKLCVCGGEDKWENIKHTNPLEDLDTER